MLACGTRSQISRSQRYDYRESRKLHSSAVSLPALFEQTRMWACVSACTHVSLSFGSAALVCVDCHDVHMSNSRYSSGTPARVFKWHTCTLTMHDDISGWGAWDSVTCCPTPVLCLLLSEGHMFQQETSEVHPIWPTLELIDLSSEVPVSHDVLAQNVLLTSCPGSVHSLIQWCYSHQLPLNTFLHNSFSS